MLFPSFCFPALPKALRGSVSLWSLGISNSPCVPSLLLSTVHI